MPSSVHVYSRVKKYTGSSKIFSAGPLGANAQLAAGILPAIEPGIHARWREFGHSGAVSPEGCQAVAGGRRGFFEAATSGKRRRKGPAPRLGCQIGFCCACSRLAWPQSQLLAGRTRGVVLWSAEPFCRYVIDPNQSLASGSSVTRTPLSGWPAALVNRMEPFQVEPFQVPRCFTTLNTSTFGPAFRAMSGTVS